MPHASSMPATGFQAIILCGPGSSFPTFTTNPDRNPKALLSIANRPMVWYPIEFCHRMGITNITLIAPPSSAPAITVALNTDRHLTSFGLPKPNILAPEGLDLNTNTAQIFRLPQVREIIKGDFIVLPCDIVCELGGESLLELWMGKETNIGSVTTSRGRSTGLNRAENLRQKGMKGGLGVWYETKGEIVVKGEEQDFIATSPLEIEPIPPSSSSLLRHTSKLVYSIPTDTLGDLTEEEKGFPIRHSLIRAHTQIRMLSSYRDAHIYIFPVWILDIIEKNIQMDSIAEDLIGSWAKAGWQAGLGEKLGFGEALKTDLNPNEKKKHENSFGCEIIDPENLSTTWTTDTGNFKQLDSSPNLIVPPILAYVHPVSNKLIRRVDSAQLLRTVSLELAKLDSIDMVGKDASSPFAHQRKIAHTKGIASRTLITKSDCLIAENVIVEESSVIKECVIGENCQVKSNARLVRCVLMENVIIGKGCELTGCILGRNCNIGENSVLQDCEVQENLLIEADTEDRDNKIMSYEGMEDREETPDTLHENPTSITAIEPGCG